MGQRFDCNGVLDYRDAFLKVYYYFVKNVDCYWCFEEEKGGGEEVWKLRKVWETCADD